MPVDVIRLSDKLTAAAQQAGLWPRSIVIEHFPGTPTALVEWHLSGFRPIAVTTELNFADDDAAVRAMTDAMLARLKEANDAGR